ncbi:hypothetical protein OPKNFCMD_6531 [Methylobacterium crusticola]|uniref:Uncharacterized protein n=1 Tax=Methylobacterium crusticola TaxID=1697972 RepID=A0ABQ4R7Q2_9HYPH|nr:hypothetical protein [Methylobacterium crusticola]GJD53753.1 hypothetical protein OPKNFCMD_6531 [Methylobacterium crusticola]
MPTTIPAKSRPATRGQADDLLIARGQIELVDALSAFLVRAQARVRRVLANRS